MKKTVILLLFLALAGCKPLKYEEVKKLEKWCSDHDMRPEYRTFGRNNSSNEVHGVYCIDAQGKMFNAARQGPQ